MLLNEARMMLKCVALGDGTAFTSSNVTSAAPLVLKFTGATGIPFNAYLHQLELQFSVLANATTTITVSLWRAYNTSTKNLTRPVWGQRVTSAAQIASPTYDATATTGGPLIASGGGCAYSLQLYAMYDSAYSTASDTKQDMFLMVQSDQAGTSTLIGAAITLTP